MSDLHCPTCGAEFDLSTLFASEADQQAFDRMVTTIMPIGPQVLLYIGLFTPPKQRLTAAKKFKLLHQLTPDLERRAISFKGRDWAAPLPAWALAIDQMLASRAAGRLELPMKGHGYLYAMLAGMADKAEASAELQREAERRAPPDRGTVQVRGQAIGVGQALPGADRSKTIQDAALAALNVRDRDAVPMPPEVRAKLDALRGRPHPPKATT